ncbi:Bidirectional sugar transporter SWEET4 [Morus notabilis]|uniref:Bidirectional sugar transporter SWEET n=1 Tax=Morus notabilis TaxID=981085 RepID=W9S739_9ROSA|nr:bidirectional sugar transporter SWEET4 [Morus notabilis]EXC14460.1 Bidirectional sugar transporter SWEET4 [Morus notabilis]
MVSTEAARTAVGIIGNIICLFFYLSPVPTFVRIWKKRSVEQYIAFPYLAALINCLAWTIYGLPMVQPGSIPVLTISAAGVAVESVYVVLFFIFSDKRKRLKVLLILLVGLSFNALLGCLVLTLVHTHKKRSKIVGIICASFSVLMNFSPLAVMKLVITTKSVEFMPFYLSFASFVNNAAWVIYALLRFDSFVLIPNGLGLLFGLTQLILHAVYSKSTKELMAARKGPKGKEVDLSDDVVAEEPPKKIIGIITPENGPDSDNH